MSSANNNNRRTGATANAESPLQVQVAVLAANDSMHEAMLRRIESTLVSCVEQTAVNQRQIGEVTQLARSAHKRLDELAPIGAALTALDHKVSNLTTSIDRVTALERDVQQLKNLRLQAITLALVLGAILGWMKSDYTLDVGVRRRDTGARPEQQQQKDNPDGRSPPESAPERSSPQPDTAPPSGAGAPRGG